MIVNLSAYQFYITDGARGAAILQGCSFPRASVIQRFEVVMIKRLAVAGLLALISTAYGGWVLAADAPPPTGSSSEAFFAVADSPLIPPKGRKIRVAFVLSNPFNLIDMAGPMQTFLQAQLPPYGDNGAYPFETFTVANSRQPVTAYGGLQVTPNYTFNDAPEADIVVVGAQSIHDKDAYLSYLRRMSANQKVVMSVCTGVAVLAAAGLLDGKVATSHHSYTEEFGKRYPKVKFLSDKAYVRSAPRLFTAGGETSGFELALHIVQLYFGRDVALKTARSMEYRGPAWQN
jgi:putative intracellular protease/amidase